MGVVSRAGTLTYEAVHQLSVLGIGQSTCIGIGGDPIPGTTFIDTLREFERDPATRAVILIGESGGRAAEEAGEFVRSEMSTPGVASTPARTAPPGQRMGHAGAIIGGKDDTAQAKIESLRACGVHVADSPAEIGTTMAAALGI